MQDDLDIFEIIKEIFITTFNLSGEIITPDAVLSSDLGLDSIDAIDFIVILEKKVGYKLNMEHLLEIKTVGNVVKKVEEMIENQNK